MTTMKEMEMTGQQVYETQQKLRQLEAELSNAYGRYQEQTRKGIFLVDAHEYTRPEREAMQEQQAIVLAAQALVGGPVYRIPAENIDHLKHEIEIKVNKRADKLSLPRVEVIELEQEIIEHKKWDHEKNEQVITKSIWQYVAIKGETPKIKGYEFVATLQHEEHGNIVRQIPVLRQEIREIEIPDLTEYRTVDPSCDHCGLSRHRKDTYLVFNSETGEIRQVGSNCLGDFLGAADPQRYASYAEYLRDFLAGLNDDWSSDEPDYYGPRVEQAFEMREYLASTARMIRANGWAPASASDHPTSTQAWYNLDNYGRSDKYGHPLWIDIEEKDWQLADETLGWAREDLANRDEHNDYEWNLLTALKAKGVTYRTKGIVASAVRAFDRERENKLRHQKQQEKNAVKGYVGTVGERQDFTGLKLVKVHWIEDRYAHYASDDQTKPLYIFEDAEGNEIKWFSSRDLNLQEGDTYTLKATVKDHVEHAKFGKSTMITRAKVVE